MTAAVLETTGVGPAFQADRLIALVADAPGLIVHHHTAAAITAAHR
jgi:hypothetical protein